jgi:hypothetical protein
MWGPGDAYVDAAVHRNAAQQRYIWQFHSEYEMGMSEVRLGRHQIFTQASLIEACGNDRLTMFCCH